MTDVPACPRCGGPLTRYVAGEVPLAAGEGPLAGEVPLAAGEVPLAAEHPARPVGTPAPAGIGVRWRCRWHGEVVPLWPAYPPAPDGLQKLLRGAAVPVWLPWPLPVGWLVSGFAAAGEESAGKRACVVALSGPNPVGGEADLLLVSEEPGVGLGAWLAGLPGPDPGEGFATGPPHAFVRFGHHEAPLWFVDSPERAVYAGEVLGNWLWLVLWPGTAGVLLVEALSLRDLRDPGQDLNLPYGAASARLPG